MRAELDGFIYELEPCSIMNEFVFMTSRSSSELKCSTNSWLWYEQIMIEENGGKQVVEVERRRFMGCYHPTLRT